MALKSFAKLLLLASISLAQTISQCPTTEIPYTAPDGSKWAICPNSDYQGNSDQVFSGVSSNTLCAQVCQQYVNYGYVKAVYDHANSLCHMKAVNTPLTWVTNYGQYDSMRLISRAPAGNRGKWSGAIQLPVVPAGAFVVPEQPVSNRVLGFSSWGSFAFGYSNGQTQFADHNWQTGAVSQVTVSNTGHDMFCPGQSQLPDGRIVITGGDDADTVSAYDFRTNSWSRLANMNTARGYQASVTLSNGGIFTIGGSWSGGVGGQDVPVKNGEVYDAASNTWTSLPGANVVPMLTTYDAQGPYRTDNHGWLFGWKSGSVFQAGPSKNMNWYTTDNGGGVQSAGVRDPDNDAMCGSNVMYDALAGKIFSAGGSQSYINSDALTRAFQITIGNVGSPAQVTALSPMHYQRAFSNAVVFPNGQVLVVGGQLYSAVFTDLLSVFNAELWDPVTKKFTVLAPANVPRNYHSTALLLADATVWVGGGGMCPVGPDHNTDGCTPIPQHFDCEIFTPPYLLNADGSPAARPTIASLASDTDSTGFTVRVGGTLSVTITNPGAPMKFSLVRLGTATHSTDTDQRRVPLWQKRKISEGNYRMTLPSDSGILIPGFYYLFAMNSAGVPSVARTIQVTL